MPTKLVADFPTRSSYVDEKTGSLDLKRWAMTSAGVKP